MDEYKKLAAKATEIGKTAAKVIEDAISKQLREGLTAKAYAPPFTNFDPVTLCGASNINGGKGRTAQFANNVCNPRRYKPFLDPKVNSELDTLQSIKLTGWCRQFRVTVEAMDSCINARLVAMVPDRETGEELPLQYNHNTDLQVFSTQGAVRWLNNALRYFLCHEADEAIVLPDGTRPLDPHRTMRVTLSFV